MLFTSKANTLFELAKYPELSIPSFKFINYKEWIENRDSIILSLLEYFSSFGENTQLAIRSSCSSEDSETSSGAGAFLSLLYIPLQKKLLENSIDAVFASYEKDIASLQSTDQVII